MKKRLGAVMPEYSLLVGLIVSVAIGALSFIGLRMADSFDRAYVALDEGNPVRIEQAPGSAIPTVSLAWSGSGAGMDVLGGVSPGSRQDFTLTNNGTTPSLNMQGSIRLMGANIANFRIIENSCTEQLLPGASCSVAVEPVAGSDGAFFGSIGAYRHNGPVINLSGVASGFAAEPVFLNSGTFTLNAPDTQTLPSIIPLRNLGNTGLQGITFSIIGQNVANFEIVQDNCFGSLSAGNMCQISVRARATQNGTFVGRLALNRANNVIAITPLTLSATGF